MSNKIQVSENRSNKGQYSKTAIIGFLGTTLDNGFNDKRWQRWRPTLSLCLHDELLVDELARLGSEQQQQFRFTVDARQLYEDFATSSEATWQGNFRDLTASMIRLTTLAESKVIREGDVQAEIERLMHLWGLADGLNGLITTDSMPAFASERIEQSSHQLLSQYLGEEVLATIDPFDAVQLAYVIKVCIQHKNQAAAGRYLYANSRDKLKSPNDSDRLRKYLLKFNLKFDELG